MERELQALGELSDFALPLIEALAALPERANFRVWLEELGRIAAMALEDPAHVFTELDEPSAKRYGLKRIVTDTSRSCAIQNAPERHRWFIQNR